MNLFKTAVFSLSIILLSFTAKGQSNSHWCGTDQALEEYFQQNPEAKSTFLAEQLDFAKKAQTVRYDKSGNKLIVPVVVHVIHYNGKGNISKSQILDAIRIANEDFNKENTDTTSVRPIFRPLIEDMKIEFRLAKIDPNGNCTEGITRTNSYLSISPQDRNAPKSLIQWDPHKYFNIWVVNSIGGGNGGNILGFAQFPNMGSDETFGIVIRADEMGSIGLANTTDGRTLTHEIGHCFNLYHTFQGGCGSNCQFSGDFVCDTPPQASDNNNSCNFNLNSCSNDNNGGNASNNNPYSSNVPDQLENYMGYGLTCLGMFTAGQKDRVYTAFNSYSRLSSLITQSNLNATGTNDGYSSQDCTPIAEIINQSNKTICVGSSLTFTENSYGGPIDTYKWTFENGTPSVSNNKTPTITYNQPGRHNVTLEVSNSTGKSTLTLNDFVIVSDSSQGIESAYNFTESFENQNILITKWSTTAPEGEPEWKLSNFALDGSLSVMVENFNSKIKGNTIRLISPTINMTDVLEPEIQFQVSYSRKGVNDNDEIKLMASNDCGLSWSNIVSLPPTLIAFDNTARASAFSPSGSNQWRTINIPEQFIPDQFKSNNNVKFALELKTGGGNNIYIDDFRILGEPVGLKELNSNEHSFSFFPNPATNKLQIGLNLKEESKQTEIYISNILGKRVKDIVTKSELMPNNYHYKVDLSDLASGIYFITLQTQKGRKSQKLIIQ